MKPYYTVFGNDKVLGYIANMPTFIGNQNFAYMYQGNCHPWKNTHMSKESINAFADKHNLDYYDGDIHTASFAIPKNYIELLNKAKIV